MFYKDVGHSQEGAQVTKVLEAGAFDGPKPLRLLRRLLTLANLENDSIILRLLLRLRYHCPCRHTVKCRGRGQP